MLAVAGMVLLLQLEREMVQMDVVGRLDQASALNYATSLIWLLLGYDLTDIPELTYAGSLR